MKSRVRRPIPGREQAWIQQTAPRGLYQDQRYEGGRIRAADTRENAKNRENC